jgi:hypothetical protein
VTLCREVVDAYCCSQTLEMCGNLIQDCNRILSLSVVMNLVVSVPMYNPWGFSHCMYVRVISLIDY